MPSPSECRPILLVGTPFLLFPWYFKLYLVKLTDFIHHWISPSTMDK